MPDTGAPWNIPYVENADLVKDYPTASLALANAIADGLDAAGGVVQTVATFKSSVFSTTSATYVDVTGLAVTITPTSAANDIIILAGFSLGNSFDDGNRTFCILTDGTNNLAQFSVNNREANDGFGRSIVRKDSPATTSAVTYKFQMATDAGSTGYIGRGRIAVGPEVSYIVAIEVKV